ncbi:MAG: hypothetical protein WBF77_03360 [Sulfurimonadaceae bacterium]
MDKKAAMYVADVSAMPAIISFFVLPMLISNDFPILVIDDEDKAAIYKNDEHIEDVMIVILENKMVTDIKYIKSEEELIKEMER